MGDVGRCVFWGRSAPSHSVADTQRFFCVTNYSYLILVILALVTHSVNNCVLSARQTMQAQNTG